MYQVVRWLRIYLSVLSNPKLSLALLGNFISKLKLSHYSRSQIPKRPQMNFFWMGSNKVMMRAIELLKSIFLPP